MEDAASLSSGQEIAPTATAVGKRRKDPLAPRQCVECAEMFVPTRDHARFCPEGPGRNCRKTWNNRNLGRGAPMVPMVLAWAATRHAAPGSREAAINTYARREMTTMARLFLEDDKAEERGDVVEYVAALMDGNTLYIDRRR